MLVVDHVVCLQLPMLLSERSCRLPVESVEELRTKLNAELSEYNLTHPTLHINLYNVSTSIHT